MVGEFWGGGLIAMKSLQPFLNVHWDLGARGQWWPFPPPLFPMKACHGEAWLAGAKEGISNLLAESLTPNALSAMGSSDQEDWPVILWQISELLAESLDPNPLATKREGGPDNVAERDVHSK